MLWIELLLRGGILLAVLGVRRMSWQSPEQSTPMSAFLFLSFIFLSHEFPSPDPGRGLRAGLGQPTLGEGGARRRNRVFAFQVVKTAVPGRTGASNKSAMP